MATVKAITRTTAAVCGHSGVMLPPGLMEVSSHHNSLCRLSRPKQTNCHQHCCTTSRRRRLVYPTVRTDREVTTACERSTLFQCLAQRHCGRGEPALTEAGKRERGGRESHTTCPSEASLSNRMNGLEIGANQEQGAGIKAESRFNPQQQQNRTRIRAHPAH